MIIRAVLSEPLGRAALVAVVLLSLGAALVAVLRGLDPRVLPMAPPDALFAVTERAQQADVTLPESLDFVARPLFEMSRRPKIVVEAAPVEEISDPREVATLEGVHLVGVFSSAGTSGAIVVSEEDRQRVLVGQEYEGWNLEAVQGRSVVFVAGGRRVRLQMEAITEVVLPVVSEPAAAEADDNAASDDGRITFESMYRKMKEKQEQSNAPQT